MLIPTDTPGVVRRPFASVCDHDDVDFNEVFFTDARVPAENLVGELDGGWRVASGSLGHERAMLWMDYAGLLDLLAADFTPSGALERDRYATLVMDTYAMRLMGSTALAQAARGEEDVPAQSVLKLLGSEAIQRAAEDALNATGADGLVHPAISSPFAPLYLDSHFGSWFDRYARSFAGTIAGGTSEIQRNIIAAANSGPAAQLTCAGVNFTTSTRRVASRDSRSTGLELAKRGAKPLSRNSDPASRVSSRELPSRPSSISAA